MDEGIEEGVEETAQQVKAAQRGEAAAFRSLYRQHRPAVLRLLAGFPSLDADEREDIAQETFIRALRGVGGLREAGAFGRWVLAIARLRALTALAAKRRHRHVRGPELGWLEDTGHAELTLVWSAERDARVVRELVTALPEGPEKDTVALAYLEGEASAREIALQLGVGKSAVCMRLQRFRRRVRTQLSARLVSARGE